MIGHSKLLLRCRAPSCSRGVGAFLSARLSMLARVRLCNREVASDWERLAARTMRLPADRAPHLATEVGRVEADARAADGRVRHSIGLQLPQGLSTET